MKQNTVTQTQIDNILKQSTIEAHTVFDKCTVMTVQLPNGFILVEASACVDPANYSYELGCSICLERIKNRLWELEGYKLQDQMG